MRSVYFSEILHGALQLCGLDRNLTTPERFGMVRDFTTMRLRSIWEMNDWPELKNYTKCTTSVEYVDSPAPDPNPTPPLNPYAVPNGGRVKVNFDASIGQILAIWNMDPLGHRAVEKDFTMIGSDTYLESKINADVWVESRKECPILSGAPWSDSVSYRKGAQVYFDAGSVSGSLVPVNGFATQGDFYEYSGQTPTVAGTTPIVGEWNRIQIPKLFANALINGVHADFRRSTNELEAAQAAEADSQKALDAALDQVLRQQGAIRKINFRGY